MTVTGLGHFDGKIHILPLRVYYEDTDLSGVVYHANYLRYMERGRTEFFRLAGVERMAELEAAEPTAWTLREVKVSYLRPARLDDALTVRSRLISLSGARMGAVQKIYANETLLVDGQIEACIVTLKGQPRRLPQQLRDLLTPFLSETNT
ncbi:MAG TPA: YbgC/FadM family acyl-CoA thioesterase [Rhizomicrobium sp.]|jgi:acyl-CoA thioester hydrolase|nr:YbgC/FadM family acyl-CoA thioesterase [Rhizomicrobium sp.]